MNIRRGWGWGGHYFINFVFSHKIPFPSPFYLSSSLGNTWKLLLLLSPSLLLCLYIFQTPWSCFHTATLQLVKKYKTREQCLFLWNILLIFCKFCLYFNVWSPVNFKYVNICCDWFYFPLCLQLRAPAGSTNAFPQTAHWWSFFPSCLFTCTLRLVFFMNILGQLAHWNSFTPRCIRSCPSLEVWVLKHFSQPSLHLNGLSPVCNVIWLFSFCFLLNSFLQSSQVKISDDISCFANTCPRSEEDETYFLSQCSHSKFSSPSCLLLWNLKEFLLLNRFGQRAQR